MGGRGERRDNLREAIRLSLPLDRNDHPQFRGLIERQIGSSRVRTEGQNIRYKILESWRRAKRKISHEYLNVGRKSSFWNVE